MRFKTKRPFQKVTVPMLFDHGNLYTDSWDIAVRAEALGSASPLLAEREECAHWNRVAERGMACGRARTVDRLLEDEEAQVDSLRVLLPDVLCKPFRPLAIVAAKGLTKKYTSPPPQALEEALLALRRGLDGNDYLLGEFSFADMAMASMLEFVSPGTHVRRSGPERRIWSDARLASRYADLIAWRDQLRERHG